METNYILVRIISILTFIYITRLIYNNKLKIGYSWFLFLLGIGFLVLAIWPSAINLFYWLTGSDSWLTNVLFFLVMFLFIIVVHCTLMISRLIDRVKELGQQIAISFAEIDEKNLNKLINSLQSINTRITRDELDDVALGIYNDKFKFLQNNHNKNKEVAAISSDEKSRTKQENEDMSEKDNKSIKTIEKISDVSFPEV